MATNTIKKAIAAFGKQFQEACAGTTTSDVSDTLQEFLLSSDLPPYYRMQTHLTLSGADEQDGPWEDVWACRLHLDAAANALADCKDVYKDAGDVQHLKTFETVIKKERSEMQKRYHALNKREERC